MALLQKLLEDRFQLLLEEVDKRLLEQRQLLETMLRGHLPPGPATVSEEPAQVHSSSVVKPGVDLTRPAELPVHMDLQPILEDATLAVTALTSQDLPSAGMASEKAATLTSETSRRGSTKNGALASMEASRFSKQNSYEQAVAAEQSGNFVSRRSDPKSVLRTFKAAGTRDLTATNTRVGQLLAPLVLTWQFEFFYAALILSHAGLLGAQIEWEAAHLGESPPDVMVYTHLAFTFLFMLEIVLRMSTIGVRKFFTTGEYAWNIFDLLMVSLSVVELLVDLILQENFASGTFRILRILRLARSARGLRIIRLIRFIRPLRILVFSIGITRKSLIWSVILLLLIIYLFSILFSDAYLTTMTMASDPKVDGDELRNFFGSLQISMFTLFAAISGGLEWRHAMSSLNVVGWVWTSLFILYISFCCFAVLNVMTGVFCHSAIAGAEQDHEFMVQSMVGEQERIRTVFGELFQMMDHDESGMITIKEFEHGFKVESTRAWFEALGIKAEDAWTIFRSLDRDGDHRIGISEFVEGCINIRGPAREVDLMRQSQRTHQQLQAVEGTLLDSLVLLKDVATQLIDTSESIRASRSDGLKAPEAQLQQKTADSSHLQGVEEGSSPSAI